MVLFQEGISHRLLASELPGMYVSHGLTITPALKKLVYQGDHCAVFKFFVYPSFL